MTASPQPSPHPAASPIILLEPRGDGPIAQLVRVDEAARARRVLIMGRGIVGLLTLVLLALVGRVVQLQTQPPGPIAALVDSQRSTVELRARRGNLVDRRGQNISVSRVAPRLFVDPQLIEDPNTFSERIAYHFDYDPAKIEQTISQRLDRRYVVIDRELSDERVEKLKALKLPGLATDGRIVREYPQGHLAGQLVGFVGFDGKGLEGVEKIFDAQLAGTPGSMQYLRDAQHRPLWIDQRNYTPPTDGHAIRLSLDMTIQAIVEAELAKTVKEFEAQAGQMIVLDPYTGEVLAMGNYPSFDPNDVMATMPEFRRNRCVTDIYEPGSTFKPFIWAAAVEGRVTYPSELFDCTTSGVWVSPAGRRLRDAHANGMQTWEGVLMKSSNIGMAKVGIRMGAERLYRTVRAFGFGQTTGSALPGEVRGKITPRSTWTHYSITSVPMGQEIAVTPIQMARGFAVFANGGLLVAPTIRATDPAQAGSRVYERVLSQKTADLTRQVMRRAVAEGTGRKADSKLYDIFGKTGTAQVPRAGGGGYEPGQYIGSFVCGAPYDSPRIVVVTVIQRPNPGKGYYGGIVAAPCAMRAVEQTLVYMGVPPKHPDADGPRTRLVNAARLND